MFLLAISLLFMGMSHLTTISVVVKEDNKAALLVALDRRDREYYACDAGCVDPPARLSTQYKQFPVKLTEPLTAILYITADHRHMRELKEAIHVREIAEGMDTSLSSNQNHFIGRM